MGLFDSFIKDIPDECKPKGDPSKWTNDQFTTWQVEQFNNTVREPNGYDCPACKNRRFFAFVNEAGDLAMRECSCNNVIQQQENARNSGFGDMINRYTFESYEVKEAWQRKVKEGAKLYTQQKELPWLYIGGMSGSGKSHICTATATVLLHQGKVVKYIMWRDIFHKLESYRYDEVKYSGYVKELGAVEVLIIDDFLKGMDKAKQSSALEIAYDVINERYNSKKPVIISSEYQVSELEPLDRALHGKIKERCGKFLLNIKNEEKRNYRKR